MRRRAVRGDGDPARRIPGTVFTVGDNVHRKGTGRELRPVLRPDLGPAQERTFPTIGNHDCEKQGAPYFAYFGANAGPRGPGYYSFDLGAWHIVSLNSQIAAGPGSAQIAWLKADLAGDPPCTLAMWHTPLFSSGPHGPVEQMVRACKALLAARADVVLNGHEHVYERFAPQDADGNPTRTASASSSSAPGAAIYNFETPAANSEVWDNRTWGVLKLTLKTGSYDWEFVPIIGQSFRDSGSGRCVVPPAA